MLGEFNPNIIKTGNCVVLSPSSHINTQIIKTIIHHSTIKYCIVINNTNEYSAITENVYNNLNIIRKLNSYIYSFRSTPTIVVFDNLMTQSLEDQDISYLYLNGRTTNTLTITSLSEPYTIPMMLYVGVDYLFLCGSTDTAYIEQIYNLLVCTMMPLPIFTKFMNDYDNTNKIIVLDIKQSKIFEMEIA